MGGQERCSEKKGEEAGQEDNDRGKKTRSRGRVVAVGTRETQSGQRNAGEGKGGRGVGDISRLLVVDELKGSKGPHLTGSLGPDVETDVDARVGELLRSVLAVLVRLEEGDLEVPSVVVGGAPVDE